MKLRIRFAMAFVLAGCLFLGGCTVAGYEIDIDQIYPFHKETENLDGGEHDQHASVTAGKESVTETESPSKETENGFWLDTPGHYGYDSLTEKQKVWYREITDILNAMETDCSLTVEPGQEDPEKSGLELIFHCVKMDHPELFFVEGYRYSSVFSGDQLQEIYFSGIYNVTKEEAQKRAGEIEIAARQILESVPENSSDYEKIKYIYDTVIRNTDYDLDAPDNQNIYSVLVGRSSVCQGYSETMQYLLLKEGIECGLVQGEVNDGEPHAWNFVKADGEYYYVDATWGDISYQNMAGDGNSDPADYVNYDYFCVTTEELLRTHRITEELEMPLCTAKEDNYFMREGLEIRSVDLDRIKEIFSKTRAEGGPYVTFRAADYGLYCILYATLIDNNGIFDCLPDDVPEINYASNEQQYTFTFWMN